MTKETPVALFCYWDFFWNSLAPLIFLEGMVTAKQHKVTLTDHLYPIRKDFYPHGSGPWMTVPKSTRYKGSLYSLMLWPSQLPDFSPVKHLCDILVRHVTQRSPPPSWKQQLRESLLEEFCSSLKYSSRVESVHILGTLVFSAVCRSVCALCCPQTGLYSL